MATNKEYCCSSFLAFRYIYEKDIDFADGLKHEHFVQISDDKKILVKTAKDIDTALQKQFDKLKGKKLGILLSGGMDSACLASYMPGCDAYTFRFLNGQFQEAELKRAEAFAKYYNLKLHYIDINFDIVKNNSSICMKHKNAPIHSIEPQIYEGAMQAKKDGVELMIIGDAADYVFGGMDKLLSKDWNFDDFYHRFIYLEPEQFLRKPYDLLYIFEKYRLPNNKIDFLKIMDTITIDESYSSYKNAFESANMPFEDPYEILKMEEPLDLNRIRNGESKYLIRELFKMRYPILPVPEKNPMPRPVDIYFKDWQGPTREEFRDDIDMSKLSGNQKWLLYILEVFLNDNDL